MTNRQHHFSAFTILILTFLLILGTSDQILSADPGIPDTLSIDSISTYVGGSRVVPVRFYNDQPLTAIEMTLHENSPDIQIDSFSFTGGRVESATFRLSKVDTVTGILRVTVLPTVSLIPAGSGLLGKIYLSYPPTISGQFVTFDTIRFVDNFLVRTTSFSATGAVEYKPKVKKGYLDINTTPESLDSVWITHVESEQGTETAVDVMLFNQRNIANVAFALKFGSDDLQLDSVSFDGARTATAFPKTVQPRGADNSVLIYLEFDETTPLLPGSGLAARLHLSISPSATPGPVLIDSLTYAPTWSTFITLSADDGGGRFTPMFSGGSVEVRVSTGIDDETDQTLPGSYSLSQNYPNPFNPTTTIEFALPEASQVQIEVFNLLGESVRELVNKQFGAGVHHIEFDSRNNASQSLASGMYFYRIIAGSFSSSKKMILLK
ncbi:MAG: T9SS type A sorting domain-containing protein [candidate division Zixibacteria bacterium]|nr:T9SS type A sorting domain-containing protein [candidate division Zixibacteria bacterium]